MSFIIFDNVSRFELVGNELNSFYQLPGLKKGFCIPPKGKPGGKPPAGEGQRFIADKIFAAADGLGAEVGGLDVAIWDPAEFIELPFAAATAAR